MTKTLAETRKAIAVEDKVMALAVETQKAHL
jgi:hypothetical protein